jgi:hypothetical protein
MIKEVDLIKADNVVKADESANAGYPATAPVCMAGLAKLVKDI